MQLKLLYRAMHLKADRIFRETIPSRKKPGKEGKRHLDLSSLDELSDDELSEDEQAAKNAVMNENSSVEYTA